MIVYAAYDSDPRGSASAVLVERDFGLTQFKAAMIGIFHCAAYTF